jgi:hypothetical protein
MEHKAAAAELARNPRRETAGAVIDGEDSDGRLTPMINLSAIIENC